MALDQAALSELLAALGAGGGLEVVRQALALVLPAVIDAEATEVIGADRSQRSQQGTTHRNGFRSRLLSTRAGDVDLKIPSWARARASQPCWGHAAGSTGPCWRGDGGLRARHLHPNLDDLVKARGVELAAPTRRSPGSAGSWTPRCPLLVPFAWPLAFPSLFLDATSGKARVDGRVVSPAVVIAPA